MNLEDIVLRKEAGHKGTVLQDFTYMRCLELLSSQTESGLVAAGAGRLGGCGGWAAGGWGIRV